MQCFVLLLSCCDAQESIVEVLSYFRHGNICTSFCTIIPFGPLVVLIVCVVESLLSFQITLQFACSMHFLKSNKQVVDLI
jgi:hypothetical protein